MVIAVSRRDLLQDGTAAALGVSVRRLPGAPFSRSGKQRTQEDFFYIDYWFGEPWRKPETAVLIHGNDESSLVWSGWLRGWGNRKLEMEVGIGKKGGVKQNAFSSCLPFGICRGFGRSKFPARFEWSLKSLATSCACHGQGRRSSAHIIGPRQVGAIRFSSGGLSVAHAYPLLRQRPRS